MPNQNSRLRVNVGANFVGSIASMLLAILFTPVYIALLGVDAYGLIGFYITLQVSISFLEMGLSRACNRELARFSAMGKEGQKQMLSTLRSLEWVYWGVAVLIGLALTAASSWIATSWLDSAVFPPGQLAPVITLMAWVLALRWPTGLYSGALMGLQNQVLMNVLKLVVALFSWAGSAAMLWLVSADILTFFAWQLAVGFAGTLLFALFTWRVMPGSFVQACFSLSRLREMFAFAAGVGVNEILGVMLRQADKLILSAVLPLKQFGYYVLASMMAESISILSTPVSNAVFPRFSQMVAAGVPIPEIASLYHRSCQFVSILIIPLALVGAFYSQGLLFAYTGNAEIASQVATVLSILMVAKLFHTSMVVPYAMQLAYGRLRLITYINIASLCWIVPAVYLLASAYGMQGAALAWLGVTTGGVLLGMPLMHRKILAGEWRTWFLRSLVQPAGIVIGFILAIRWLSGGDFPEGRVLQGVALAAIGLCSVMLAALSAAPARAYLSRFVAKRRSV